MAMKFAMEVSFVCMIAPRRISFVESPPMLGPPARSVSIRAEYTLFVQDDTNRFQIMSTWKNPVENLILESLKFFKVSLATLKGSL